MSITTAEFYAKDKTRNKIIARYNKYYEKLEQAMEEEMAPYTRQIEEYQQALKTPIIGSLLSPLYSSCIASLMRDRGIIDKKYTVLMRKNRKKLGVLLEQFDSKKRFKAIQKLHYDQGRYVCAHYGKMTFCPQLGETITNCNACEYLVLP